MSHAPGTRRTPKKAAALPRPPDPPAALPVRIDARRAGLVITLPMPRAQATAALAQLRSLIENSIASRK